ncbi:MAG: 6-pyruvoyl trahydropterin synthase family protein [Bacteroidia bacterium]
MYLPTIRVTKSFNFEMAHALPGHDGPCKHIHGHTYFLHVTISGKPKQQSGAPDNGMVIDFGDLKRIVREQIIDPFDHALVLPEESRKILAPLLSDPLFTRIHWMPFQPTCELLVIHFMHKIREHLPKGIELITLRLNETPTSYAEWFDSDNL